MPDNHADVVLVTQDAQLRQVIAQQRPKSARLCCLSPNDLAGGLPPAARQWWVDLDVETDFGGGACQRRVYFYSRMPENPDRLPAGLFLRKPCAVPIAAILWAGVSPSTDQPDAARRRSDSGILPAWILELQELDLRELCHRCVASLPARTGYAEIALYLYNAEQDLLTLAETNCKRPVELAIPLDPGSDHALATVARVGRPLVTQDLAESCRATGMRCPTDIARQENRAAVLAPLVSQGKLCGLLRLNKRRDTELSEVGLPFEHIFAFIARSLRHARLYRRARVEARVDRLTGLLNYRWMIEALGKEIRRAQRYGSPLSLIGIDLDGLKGVNDRFGHVAGDALLRHTAGKITAALRQTDSAARIGGDEFVVLLPATELEGARQVTERILAAIRTDAPLLDHKRLPVAASAGVAEWQRGWNVKRLLQAADKAMYAAKRKGHNRLACHPRKRASKAVTAQPAHTLSEGELPSG